MFFPPLKFEEGSLRFLYFNLHQFPSSNAFTAQTRLSVYGGGSFVSTYRVQHFNFFLPAYVQLQIFIYSLALSVLYRIYKRNFHRNLGGEC